MRRVSVTLSMLIIALLCVVAIQFLIAQRKNTLSELEVRILHETAQAPADVVTAASPPKPQQPGGSSPKPPGEATAISHSMTAEAAPATAAADQETAQAATPEAFQDTRTNEGEAMFYQKMEDDTVSCDLCFHKCLIPDGKRGFCRNRENRAGTLYSVVYGKPSAVHVDPVEKEPQHHFLPGTQILCLGTAGCNFRCLHCQNWHLSQRSIEEINYYYDLTPEKVIATAQEQNIPTISFTYNDPISFYEYVYDIAKLAKENGLRILWHSNGTLNPEPLKELLKYTDAVTIDLKGFTDKFYREVSSAELAPVLETLKTIKQSGVWLEIVNLVIPTYNDDTGDIRRMCAWIRDNLGPDVPLHFSRFGPTYRLAKLPPTPVGTLETAYDIAREEGLNYVTLGNVPGHVGNSTFCPACGRRIIHRVHFNILANELTDGKCRFCGHPIPGVWE